MATQPPSETNLFVTPVTYLTPDVMDVHMVYGDNKGVLAIKPYIQTMARCHASPAYRESQLQSLQVIELCSLELTLHDRELSSMQHT